MATRNSSKIWECRYCCVYIPASGRVCINTTDILPARLYYYTRRELRALIQDSPAADYRLPIYREALEKFPSS